MGGESTVLTVVVFWFPRLMIFRKGRLDKFFGGSSGGGPSRATSQTYPRGIYSPTMTSKQLRAIRKRLDWTQVEFAERLGIHPNTLARQERGEKGIGGAVEKLARLLDEMHKPLPKRRR